MRSLHVSFVLAALAGQACTAPSEPAPAGQPAIDDVPTEQTSRDDGEQGVDPGFVSNDRDRGLPPGGEDSSASVDAGSSAPADTGSSASSDAGSSAPTSSPASKLAGEAVRELSILKTSTYSHTTYVDETTGRFDFDCSGFVGYALSRALPDRLSAVKTFTAVSRPLAKDYESFFAALPTAATTAGWTRVARAADLRAGDVVAWLKPPTLVSTNTGHVMIVRDKAWVNPARADEVLVPITDSTASPHGATDTRAPSGQGLGSGVVGLLVDGSGAPIGYRWTGGVSVQQWATEVTLGRPQ